MVWCGIRERKLMRKMKNKKVGEELIRKENEEIKQEIGGIKQEIGGMKQEIGGMKQEIGGMKQDIKELKENQKHFDRELKAINVTLENEVIKSIKIIAEGHLDLSRKLDEALKFEKEREMTNLQLVQMQGEIARLKIKVNGQ